MTRKQYVKRMRMFQRNVAKYAKENGLPVPKCADKVLVPKWGSEMADEHHKGEILTSYEQAWEVIRRTIENTPFIIGLDNIN